MFRLLCIASLAQLVEHALRKRMVMGSIPIGGCFAFIFMLVFIQVSVQTKRPQRRFDSVCVCACARVRVC